MEQQNVMDDVHRAAQQVTKARRLSKNGVRVTAAESSSSLLDHVVKTHAAEAILPETAIPAWAQGLANQVQGLANQVQGLANQVQGLANQVQGIREEMLGMRHEIRATHIIRYNSDVTRNSTELREVPKLRSGMGPVVNGIVNPQEIAVGTTLTQAGLGEFWPRTKVDIGTLTQEHLDCLCWFYNEPFDGADLAARRRAFEIFVCGY